MTDLFSQILNMSVTGSVVILFVMAVRLLLKRSPKIFSYALWSVVLFRLICPVSLSAPVSLLDWIQPEVTEASQVTSVVSFLPARYVYGEAQEDALPEFDQPRQESTEATPQEQNDGSGILEAAAYTWMVGAVVMALCSVVQYLRLRWKLVGAMVYRGDVYLADHIDSPFVMGFLWPRVYMPSHVPVKERRYIIAHERHHIRRGDHIIKLLAYGALCIHWFNPLVWAAFILAGKDMEMSCDEAVIKRLGAHIRADYSASLLRLATHRKIIAGMPLAFGEGDTKGRVLNMANWKKPKRWVSIVCLVLCIAVLAACAVNPTEDALETTAESIGAEPTSAVKQTEHVVIGREIVANIEILTCGNLTLALPEGYSGVENEKHIILSADGQEIGGITWWSTPEIPLMMPQNMAEWVKELGLPEAQESEEPIAYMIGSSVYGDLSADYFNELEPEKWNVQHEFFIDGDVVYDVYYDQNRIPDAQAEKFLKTIQIAGEPVVQADLAEPSSLEKCQAVLEMVQSGSYHILAKKENDGNEGPRYASAAYYRSGEDWLNIIDLSAEGTNETEAGSWSARSAYMHVEGSYFSNEGLGGNAGSEIYWAKDASPDDPQLPWLAFYQWNEETTVYIDTLSTDDGGECVMLRIDEVYPYGQDNQECYFVNFYFDAQGNFLRVKKEVNLFMENGFTEDESIASLEPETVAAEIQREYQRAIG